MLFVHRGIKLDLNMGGQIPVCRRRTRVYEMPLVSD